MGNELGKPKWFTWYQVRKAIWYCMAILAGAFMFIAGIIMGWGAWEDKPLWKRLLVVVVGALIGIGLFFLIYWQIKKA